MCDPRYDGVCSKVGSGTANQHPLLNIIFGLFYRHHNRIATRLAQINPHWDDERLYQETRNIVIAQIQAVTFKEYMPLTIGNDMMKRFHLDMLTKEGEYTTYDENLNPTMRNEFGTAVWRFGHTLIQGNLPHATNDRTLTYSKLRDQFFHPKALYQGQFDPMLRGMTYSPMGAFDPELPDDVRNHLYKRFNVSFGQDLASLNIQRGRDHGVRGYIDYVYLCHNDVITSFKQLEKYISKERLQRLESIYTHVSDIDLWTAGIAETPLSGAVVGPTFACLMGIQWHDTKFGDRFYFEHKDEIGSFTSKQLQALRKTTLSAIVCRNSDTTKMQRNAFRLVK